MRTTALNDTERVVLSVIEERGTVDQRDILRVLDPDLGMYYLAEVLETLYAFRLIREVDVACYGLRPAPDAA